MKKQKKQATDWLKLNTVGEINVHLNWNAVLRRNSGSASCWWSL